MFYYNTATALNFVPKDIAIKINLPLYRILNEQIDMKEKSCFVLISLQNICFEAILTNIQNIIFLKVLTTIFLHNL